ncbi:TPA: right-handed parallel beta-helix repeat-containing protein [Candidatus Poribacteria bacterium]|nr:right-handed parallel beta-helix repeat-containing protein [Candidatus Poribacteria bacterium]
MKNPTQNVLNFSNVPSFTSGLQEAIDALPESGGVVEVPPGIYTLQRHVRLRNNVLIRGSGNASRITRTAEVSSPLAQEANDGDVAVQVESAKAFNPGMEISIFDTTQRGWHATHAVIRGIDDNILHLDQPINTNRPCLRERNGTVAHAFSAFVAWEVHDCGLQSLSVDGGERFDQSVFADFTISAIHFVRTIDARIRDCVVRHWPADGVSVQGGSGTIVTNCLSQGCLGHGFHPGTSVKHSLWINNIGRENGRDGLYFCMHVRHSVVSNSTFHGNGRYGIGGLGDGGDQYNLVANNTCVDNARHGIEASGGKNNTISSNICLNNSQEEAGKYSGIGLCDVTGMTVNANRCLDDQEISTQGYGIEEKGESNQNLIVANHCQGNLCGGIMTIGDRTKCTENLE